MGIISSVACVEIQLVSARLDDKRVGRVSADCPRRAPQVTCALSGAHPTSCAGSDVPEPVAFGSPCPARRVEVRSRTLAWAAEMSLGSPLPPCGIRAYCVRLGRAAALGERRRRGKLPARYPSAAGSSTSIECAVAIADRLASSTSPVFRARLNLSK